MEYKELKNFTIEEFKIYEELLKDVENNIDEIFKMFEIEKSIYDMSISEYNTILTKLIAERPENKTNEIKKQYELNGVMHSIDTNMLGVSAAQFINIQTAVASKKTEKILACFLIPMIKSKTIFGKTKWKKQKYGADTYSTLDVENDIYKYMKIGDALAISFFFMNYTQKLLKVFHQYLAKKTFNQKKNLIKIRKKNLTVK